MPVKEFSFPVRVYYEDTDAGGVVYHANYLKFFERARTEWLRSIGFEQDQLIEQEDVVFAVRKAEVEYQLPARFNESLLVKTVIGEIKNASLLFEQALVRESNEQTLCTLLAQVACVSASTLKPCAIPQAIKKQAGEYCER